MNGGSEEARTGPNPNHEKEDNMSGPNDILTKTYIAEAAVTKHRIVKFGATDENVLHAVNATDLAFGVTLHDAAIGERVEVQILGLAEVEAGGNLARGEFIQAGAAGVAVQMAAAATVKVAAGRAMVAAVSGDVFPMMIVHSIAVTA
jgi:uncharacterized protein DUF2190